MMDRASNPPCFLAALVIVVSCIIMNVSSLDEPSSAPVSAPAPGPSQGPSCEDVVISNMLDCISFISAGNSSDRPEGTCCSGLKTVLDFNGACICVAISGSSQYGIQINMTRAEQLPSICNLKPYPLEKCGITGISGPSPVEPPSNPSPKSPSPAPAQSDTPSAPEADDGGQKTPAEAPKSSGCHSLISSSLATLFSIALVVYS